MRRRAAACALLLSLVLVGCGVPDRDRAEPIPGDQLPTGLSTSAPDRPSGSATASLRPNVYFVDGSGHLVARPLDPSVASTSGSGGGTSTSDAASAVLATLLAGPGSAEAESGLSTALRPDARLKIIARDGDLVEVDWYPGEAPPVGEPLVRSTGQIVLSLTSVPGIARVRFTRDGAAVGIPSADGALVERPLTAQDYGALRARS